MANEVFWSVSLRVSGIMSSSLFIVFCYFTPNSFRLTTHIFNNPFYTKSGETIWSPSSTSSTKSIFQFAPLDDVVMGGASSSTIDNNTGMWTGTVTDANNGGFVGIRSTPFSNGLSLDMSDCKGVELRLRLGNGKRFKFVVRDSTEFNGVCWTTSFDATVNGGVGNGLTKLFDGSRKIDNGDDFKSITVRVPFEKQIPTIFAKTVPGKVFDVKNVVGFQLAYSKFEYDGKLNENFELGEFSLQLLELKAC
ncbi:hypothetical protein ACHAXS_011704 [Conticribra weissflogii]